MKSIALRSRGAAACICQGEPVPLLIRCKQKPQRLRRACFRIGALGSLVLACRTPVHRLKRSLHAELAGTFLARISRDAQFVHRRSRPSDGREIEVQILRLNGLGADDADEAIVVLLGALGEAGENERKIAGMLRPRVDAADDEGAGENDEPPHARNSILFCPLCHRLDDLSGLFHVGSGLRRGGSPSARDRRRREQPGRRAHCIRARKSADDRPLGFTLKMTMLVCTFDGSSAMPGMSASFRGENLRVVVIDLQPLGAILERDDPSRREHARLSHAAAEHLADRAAALDEVAAADDHRSDRSAKPFAEAELHGVEFPRHGRHGLVQIGRRVEYPARRRGGRGCPARARDRRSLRRQACDTPYRPPCSLCSRGR